MRSTIEIDDINEIRNFPKGKEIYFNQDSSKKKYYLAISYSDGRYVIYPKRMEIKSIEKLLGVWESRLGSQCENVDVNFYVSNRNEKKLMEEDLGRRGRKRPKTGTISQMIVDLKITNTEVDYVFNQWSRTI
jgi:hypothetical protein